MKCDMCGQKAKIISGNEVNGHTETYWGLSWKHVNLAEYERRKSDGRTTTIQKVCSDCYFKHTGIDRRGKTVGDMLHKLNKKRKAVGLK